MVQRLSVLVAARNSRGFVTTRRHWELHTDHRAALLRVELSHRADGRKRARAPTRKHLSCHLLAGQRWCCQAPLTRAAEPFCKAGVIAILLDELLQKGYGSTPRSNSKASSFPSCQGGLLPVNRRAELTKGRCCKVSGQESRFSLRQIFARPLFGRRCHSLVPPMPLVAA